MNRRTRIKICGITRLEDALAACNAGADALGFVFYPKSPRCVSAEQAFSIGASLPPLVTRVGLFVDADAREIQQILQICRLDLLQFHGDESADNCRIFGTPYLKAVRMKPDLDLLKYTESHEGAQGFLLDAYVPLQPGGTGTTFDWSRVPTTLQKPIILSGGLCAENVQSAIAAVKPWAVDVSSGVEDAPGKKSPAKMEAFCAAVRYADSTAI